MTAGFPQCITHLFSARLISGERDRGKCCGSAAVADGVPRREKDGGLITGAVAGFVRVCRLWENLGMSMDSTGRISRREVLAGVAAAATAAAAELPVVRLSRKVRLGLLGLEGHPGEILRPLKRLPDVRLVALYDRYPERLARAARNPVLGAAHRYRDYSKMLDKEKLDLVAVCNTNGGRAAAVLACVQHGLPVIAEKPLALNRTDLDRIRAAVKQQGVRLSMLLPMRFSARYLAMKTIVDRGDIGEVVQLASQKSYVLGNRPEWMKHRASYGGTIPWIGIHMIDLMRWASGREYTEVFSLANHVGSPKDKAMENVTASVFGLDNGGAALLRMDYLRPETAPSHGDDRLRLAGTEGIVEYQAATGVTLITAHTKLHQVRDLPPEGSVFIDFLELVYNGKRPALSLADVYRTTEVTIAAQESAERHRLVRC